jgi:hypothetical protein
MMSEALPSQADGPSPPPARHTARNGQVSPPLRAWLKTLDDTGSYASCQKPNEPRSDSPQRPDSTASSAKNQNDSDHIKYLDSPGRRLKHTDGHQASVCFEHQRHNTFGQARVRCPKDLCPVPERGKNIPWASRPNKVAPFSQ